MFSTRMSKVAPALTLMVASVLPPTRIRVAWRTFQTKQTMEALLENSDKPWG